MSLSRDGAIEGRRLEPTNNKNRPIDRREFREDFMLLNRRRLIQSATVLWGGAATGVGWAATPRALTFLSTGDWGMGGDHFQRQVGHSMGAWAEHLDSR